MKRRIAKRETEAFVELYDLHGDALLRYLTSRVGPTDACDVLQNVFARLFRSHKRLAKAENLAAYIFMTARNEVNRFVGGKQKVMTKALDGELDVADSERAIDKNLEDRETVAELLGQLNPEVQEVVRLKIFSGLTFKEVGEIVGVPEQTAATKYRRALEKLRKYSEAKSSGKAVRGSMVDISKSDG